MKPPLDLTNFSLLKKYCWKVGASTVKVFFTPLKCLKKEAVAISTFPEACQNDHWPAFILYENDRRERVAEALRFIIFKICLLQ